MIETKFGKRIKIFRSDPGGEFCATYLDQFFNEKGILTQQSCPGTPEQNGVVELSYSNLVFHLNFGQKLFIQLSIILTDRVLPFLVISLFFILFFINHQITCNFVFLVVSVLCCSHHMNDINCLQRLLNVFSLVIVINKKALFVMILYITA